MSRANAIFSCTPSKNVKSSPATNRQNSAKTVKSQQSTPKQVESSPRKCKIQTEVKSSPSGMRGTNINIRSKLQFSDGVSPNINQKIRTPITNLMKDHKTNEEKRGCLQYNHPIDKANKASAVSKPGSSEAHSNNTDLPGVVNVKSMRSCFERKENKYPCRPPPSPSPSRATQRNTNSSLKGILSKTRNDGPNTPIFRAPATTSNTPTSKHPKLRRSLSAGTLLIEDDSPRQTTLYRSISQNITPKRKVRFYEEATPECFSPVLLEGKGEQSGGESIIGETTNLTVAVRVRPTFPGERSVVSVENNTVTVKAMGSEQCFSYDYCFGSSEASMSSQEDVFNTMVQPLVDVAFQGYNVCLFAYGQTGSGKSYSMMGECDKIPESAGIIPRFSQQLFQIIERSPEYSHTRVEISYFEIYNEKIHDLLGPSQKGRGAPLRVREHPELGPYVVDLTVHTVHSFDALQEWLNVGNDHKATAETEMNKNSSRSHTIFTVTLTQSQTNENSSLCSKINLIDLAGSERLAQTCATGDRLREGVSINRSLLTLSKVISSLAENKKRGFIPYRESVLTWLLRESLGGNSRTAMLATISPSALNVEDTLSTLRYACQARNIVNLVRVNESPQERRIRELLDEIKALKENDYLINHSDCVTKVQDLQSQLDQKNEDLSKTSILCAEREIEIGKLTNELLELQESGQHYKCEDKINKLEMELSENHNWKTKFDHDLRDLEKCLLETKDKNRYYRHQINELEQIIKDITNDNNDLKKENLKKEKEVDEYKAKTVELKTEIKRLSKELAESKLNSSKTERDLSEMKQIMKEIKTNSSHDHCDKQISIMRNSLIESEKIACSLKEKIISIEKKNSELSNITNHNGCEKEIETLKDTISDLKQKVSDHDKCDSVIEKLKVAQTEDKMIIDELQNKVSKLINDKSFLQSEIEQYKTTIQSIKNENKHEEFEERINTLKKALSVAKSMNSHVHCETRISELELELQNLQTEHSKCDEKINGFFYAIEKYADENVNLSSRLEEIPKLKNTIENLEMQLSKLSSYKDESKDLLYLESKLKAVKDENSKIKKKRVDDEKKISTLEHQVISLTKELLEVKNQLRSTLRERESSNLLCTQLQEQLTQQDRKLARSQDKNHLQEDKENWETPSKVIRRSIARYSSSNKRDSGRCSLVMKAEEIHQALKDAEDICCRLRIPWVFHLEPEVTTHSWFDVNVRVWDQRNMSSVRWPQQVFLDWLRDMKEEIMSKPRGHKLFHSASWLQKSKAPDLLPQSELLRKGRPLQEEVESIQSQIGALESLGELKDKREALAAVTALGRAVTQLSNKLGLSSPLRPLS